MDLSIHDEQITMATSPLPEQDFTFHLKVEEGPKHTETMSFSFQTETLRRCANLALLFWTRGSVVVPLWLIILEENSLSERLT